MSKPLTGSSDVQCGHQGKVSVTGTSKLTVSGNKVLLKAGVATKSISGCSTVTTPSGNHPCLTVVSVLPVSLATKLTVNGQPVVLDTLKGVTDGLPIGNLTASAKQSKLKAV